MNFIKEELIELLEKQEEKQSEFCFYGQFIETPLGMMFAIVDNYHLYLLQFIDQVEIKQKITVLKSNYKRSIILKKTDLTSLIEKKLRAYFSGNLKEFTIPIKHTGTFFENTILNLVANVPFGKTTSYLSLAHSIENRKAFRAVANANRKNYILIIVSCHRIIKSNGDLFGYNGGIERKEWLISHERKYI